MRTAAGVALSIWIVVAYAQNPKSCGRPRIQPVLEDEDRVLGGTEAVPGSWPWHAGIYTNQLYPAHICSGVLISKRHVLTAVHCLTRKTAKMIRVHLGAHLLNRDDTGEVSYEVKEICHHRNYTPPHTNDLIIITLKEEVNFTDTISPVCLPKSMEEAAPNSSAFVTGWGRFEANSDTLSPHLKQARTKTMSHETCNGEEYDARVPQSILCADHDSGSSCKGDSGGPLVLKSGDTWFLHGVVSGGPMECGNREDPLLFTKVSHFLDDFITAYIKAKNPEEKHRLCKIM
ncbi:chymotrypsin-like protease CTRL-1 [Ixodes scapularis]